MSHRRSSNLDAILRAYAQHQDRTRGLRPRTLQGYQYVTRLFVRTVLGEDPIDDKVGVFRPKRLVSEPHTTSLAGRKGLSRRAWVPTAINQAAKTGSALR